MQITRSFMKMQMIKSIWLLINLSQTMIILFHYLLFWKNSIILRSFILIKNLMSIFLFNLSESDYLINELVISLMQYFNKEISKFIIRQWKMLIWNKYNSHTDYAVIDWCWKHHIVSVTLSLHSTHLIQSLHVICFQSFKHYHQQALDQSFWLDVYDFNQLNFIAAFNEMHANTFKSFIIISSFMKADLILYNFEKVLTSLHK